MKSAARCSDRNSGNYCKQVDFGDFTWFQMDEAAEGRFNGGFARAATVISRCSSSACSWSDRSTVVCIAPPTYVTSTFAVAMLKSILLHNETHYLPAGTIVGRSYRRRSTAVPSRTQLLASQCPSLDT